MNVRLGDQRSEKLRTVAEAEGRSMNETINRAIDEYVGRREHAARREAILDEIHEEYGELHRLLAQ
jgi:predicted transcriptional regulator